jgi:hypothetical protein
LAQEFRMIRFAPARAFARSLAPALVLLALSLTAAHAQFLAPALDRSGADVRLRQPSLRLKSLGGVYLAMEDENNEINLWDFAGSANGLLRDRDSTSLDLYLDRVGRTDRHTLGPFEFETDRQSAALFGIQAVGRGTRFAAGVEGGFVSFDRALPSQFFGYEDRKIRVPVALPALNGRIGGHASWALRGIFARESVEQNLHLLRVEDGTVPLEGGDAIGYPTVFDIVEAAAPTSGIGFGLGYDLGTTAEVAVNLDLTKTTLKGNNNGPRRVYEIEESRPSRELSGAIVFTPTPWARGAVQAGRLTSDSDETYRFTVSGGQGVPPLQSRGNRLSRDFEQSYLRSRVRLKPTGMRALTVGADVNVRYDREDLAPGTGAGNFNDFLAGLQADSLLLPPAIVSERQELRHWDAGLGIAYAFGSRIVASIEGHRFNNARDGLAVHARQRITDLRAGVEVVLDPSWTVRLGGSHRADDPDVFTYDNERVRNAFTAGVGWAKPRSNYALDAGFEIARASTDFADPTEGTGSGLRLFLYNRWDF